MPPAAFSLLGLVWGKGSRGEVGYVYLVEIQFCRCLVPTPRPLCLGIVWFSYPGKTPPAQLQPRPKIFLAAPATFYSAAQSDRSEHQRCLEGLMPCLAVKDFSGGSWGRRAERGCRRQPGGRGIAVTCCYCRAGGELVKFAAGFPHPCSSDWHCIPGASDSALSPLGLECQHYVFIRYYGL